MCWSKYNPDTEDAWNVKAEILKVHILSEDLEDLMDTTNTLFSVFSKCIATQL